MLGYDPVLLTYHVNGHALPLTFTETRLLRMLHARRGGVVSQDEIIAVLHGGATERSAPCQHVKEVRKKLQAAGSPGRIVTVRGVGWRWEEP